MLPTYPAPEATRPRTPQELNHAQVLDMARHPPSQDRVRVRMLRRSQELLDDRDVLDEPVTNDLEHDVGIVERFGWNP